jgi:biotin operon repressor
MLPQDPIILLSYINTQLRDNYRSLDALADGLDISDEDMQAVIKKLSDAGYSYDEASNSFR